MTLVSFLGGVDVARTPNEKQRQNKTRIILEQARQVFCMKGFLDVTMQDIIDACGISRGGIYLYYSSVDEILQEVIKQRNKDKFSIISKAVQNNEPFASVLSDFVSLQKRRLLRIKGSLFRAYCEYIFSKPIDTVRSLRDEQLGHLRKSVYSILMLGVNQGIIRDEKISRLTDHIIVVIDGLSVLSLSDALTQEVVDEQFDILGEMIDHLKKEHI